MRVSKLCVHWQAARSQKCKNGYMLKHPAIFPIEIWPINRPNHFIMTTYHVITL